MNQLSQKQSELKCTELLSFPEAKLRILEDSVETSGYHGILRVIYVYNLDRFILYHNDWSYALLKRLPVTALSGNTLNSRSYAFPSNNGSFILDLQQVSEVEDLYTLETILKNNSQFYFQEVQQSSGSLDDKYDLTDEVQTTNTTSRNLVRQFSHKFFVRQDNNLILEAEIGHERLKDLGFGVAEIMYVNRQEVELAIIRSNDIARSLHGMKEEINEDFGFDTCAKIEIEDENETNQKLQNEDENIFKEEQRIVELMDKRHLTQTEAKEMESRERKLQRMIEKRDTKILKLAQESDSPYSPRKKGHIALNESEVKEDKPSKSQLGL